MRKTVILLLAICMIFFLNGCNSNEKEKNELNYLVLVNKLNPLPEDWEEKLEIVTITNSVGDEVEVEKKAYEAYEKLREDLEKNDGIYTELDSARRSVATQQRIMDDFIEKYGADYAAKTVAKPGYSEHHTGLALDLYFKLKNEDGSFIDVYYNEDMVQYPEIWEKIHAKLSKYGFILRYLENKEHITGYGYEPWHIRYVDSVEIAEKIMSDPGMTLEVYLGADTDSDVTVAYGNSDIFTAEELEEAIIQIKCRFSSLEGCVLTGIRYFGDGACTEENLKMINDMNTGDPYVQVAEFITSFHTTSAVKGDFDPDTDYDIVPWWLGRTADGSWDIVKTGN